MIPFSEVMKSHPLERVSGHCETHGDFTTYRMRGSEALDCPKCMDERMDREMAARTFKVRLENLGKANGVPARYAGHGFSAFEKPSEAHIQAVGDVTEFMRAVRHSVRHGLAWRTLVMVGDVGTGKTHLACALVNNLVKRGISARYVTMPAMLADIKRAYSANDLTEAGQIARYVDEPDLLVIDEADVIRGTENDLGLIFGVINGRYNVDKPMALVSNQSVDGLVGFIGQRAVSRLRENMVLVACNWGDFRVKVASGVVSNRNQGE